MTIDEIKEKVNGQEYEFLKNDEHLGSNIILLGLGGSYSYGIRNCKTKAAMRSRIC